MSAQPVLLSIPQTIQLQRILYATDFSRASERALPIVSAIARHYGSQVFLAHIFPTKPYPLPGVGSIPRSEQEEEEKEARGLMAHLLLRPELENLCTTVELESGRPVERINHYVRNHCIDLVIIGTHGRKGLPHTLMGSVAEDLFRTLKCAVLTVGPNIEARFTVANTIKNILFPTDMSPESKSVFPFLASLAAEFESEIVLLHVLPQETGTNPDARKLAEPLRQQMQHLFAPQLSHKCKAQCVLEFGDVAQRILSAADCYKSDLIGMGIREGNELITHLRTTAAYRVVIGAQCPVLTVRGTL
jgi:nucleotide-binding universal stress UspA family protein